MQNFEKKTILVTGGAGFIGYNVVKQLEALGHRVIVYDAFINFIGLSGGYLPYLKHRLKEINGKCEIVRGDIRNADYFLKTLKRYRPEIIIQLAAIPISSASNKFVHEALQINLDGIVAILKAIGSVDFIKKIVYASSSFVYGHFQYIPVDEKHSTTPIDVYGATKLSGENLIKGFGTRFGVPYIIIRPSAVYGPTGANQAVSQILIEQAFNGQVLTLNNGGDTYLDFSFVEDVAQGFVLATLSDVQNETFNITQGEARTIQDFVDILKRYFPDLQITGINDDEKRPKRGALDIKKAREMLGYDSKHSLELGIEKYVKFLKEFYKK